MAGLKNLGRKLATLSGANAIFGRKTQYKFKSPILNKFIQGRNAATIAGGKVALGLAGAGALNKLAETKGGGTVKDAAKKFMASNAGAKEFISNINQKEQGIGFDLDLGGSFGGGGAGGSDTSNTSDKVLAWIKTNFVWILVILGAILLFPLLIGFMRKSSRKTPSRRKPISRVSKRPSYRGKSMSTRAKQLAALARGRAKRLRNLRAKKK